MNRSTKPTDLKAAQIRAEGVLEVGMVGNFPYVLTPKRLLLFRGEESLIHLRNLAEAYPRMQQLRDQGWRTLEVAAKYGVSEKLVVDNTHYRERRLDGGKTTRGDAKRVRMGVPT